MKHANKLWLILAVIALTGFVVIACDNGNGNGACTHTAGAAATCTTDQTCTKCGIVIVGKLNHNFADNWILTTPADYHCETEGCKNGIETLTCTLCPATNGTRISDPCKGTQALVIENGVVTKIPNNLTLTVVCIPDKSNGVAVTSIEDYAFRDNDTWQSNTNLTSVKIGANVETIGDNAFQECISLETVTFAPNSQLQTIGGFAFENCTSLVSITIPASVVTIGSFAFGSEGEMNLETVTFAPNSQLITIGSNAFELCIILSSIEIPASVTSIYDRAFISCTNLEIVTVLAITPPELGEGVFYNTHANLQIKVPAESLDAYRAAPNWSDYADIIEAIE